LEYSEIANRLDISESRVRHIVSDAARKIAHNGDTYTLAIVVKHSAPRLLKSLERLEARAARALRLAQEVGLKPRVQSEMEEIYQRVHAQRLRLGRASVHMDCMSIECRPEKLVYVL
jgi:hypothetical protein